MNQVSSPTISTPSPIFSPWSVYSTQGELGEKRLRLDTSMSCARARAATIASTRPKGAAISTASILGVPSASKDAESEFGGGKGAGSSTLKPLSLMTPRRLHRAPALNLKNIPSRVETVSVSTGSSLKISQSSPVGRGSGITLHKMHPISAGPPIAPTRRRPPPLKIDTAAAAAAVVGAAEPLRSPTVLTPTIRAAASSLYGGAGPYKNFGEASPTLYTLPTPPPVSWAPALVVVPPTPTGSDEGACGAALGSDPPTPAWPRSSSSLKATIFDHIGKMHLSPSDLRGYVRSSMAQ